MLNDIQIELQYLLWLNLAAFAIYALLTWRRGYLGVGLIFAYIAHFAMAHIPGAFAHAVPASPFADSETTLAGFKLATYGLIALMLGSLLLTPVFSPVPGSASEQKKHETQDPERVAKVFLIAGAIFWLMSLSGLAHLPSLGAVISMGKQLLLVGISIKCWLAWKSSNKIKLAFWLTTALMFPLLTIITQGFLGYGVSALIVICAFVAYFFRPRWPIVLTGLFTIYFGLSFFVLYIDQRTEIRNSVWGGQSYETRLDVMLDAVEEFEWFSPANPDHLVNLDSRLNLNDLVGAGRAYTPEYVDYANGETLYFAVVALVPRILWPDKPVTAGSMGLATQYTGRYFMPGTTVGIGQVLELYINFGVYGVVIGFFIFGGILGLIDRRAGIGIRTNDLYAFGLWFLIGAACMRAGGSLVEITASVAGAAIAALLVKHLGSHFFLGRPSSLPN